MVLATKALLDLLNAVLLLVPAAAANASNVCIAFATFGT